MTKRLLRLSWLGLSWLGLLHASSVSAQADQPELTPQDFAYGRAVQLPEQGGPLFAVDLPSDIYRKTSSSELRDLWVFNAAGQQVSHALQSAATAPGARISEHAVPFYPVARTHVQQPLGVSIAITRGTDGEVLSLHSAPGADATATPGDVAAYILDLSALHCDSQAAHFVWADAPENLLLPLQIESSSDLVQWSTLPATGGLLHLEHRGQRIERDRMEWPAQDASFLRVRPAQPSVLALPAILESVSIECAVNAAAPKLERIAIEATKDAADSSIYRFDLGGPLPVQEVELVLPEDNSIVAGELRASTAPTGPWHSIGEARFYRVSVSRQPLVGPRLRALDEHARYYQLKLDRTHTGLGQGLPILASYHRPEQLLFLRRGPAPFTVSYGHHGIKRDRFQAQELRALAVAAGQTTDATHAELAAAQTFAGEAALQPPAPPPPYKTYALWAVLILGAALLLWFGYRLALGAV